MPNKSLFLALALGVAGLVLLLTVLLGGPGHHDDNAAKPADRDVFVPETGDSKQLPLGEAEGLVYEVKEQGVLFFANRIIPRAEGEIDAVDTTIQIHLSPDTELIVEADEGTIIAPDQHPEKGEVRGHVLVTLYESPDGSPPDTDTDRDVVMRMYFDDPVEFDLELQQIYSDGAVFITGPQVQFKGRTLSMNYNQLKQRIERLTIQQGELLRYIPQPVSTRHSVTPTAEPGSPGVSPPSNPNHTPRPTPQTPTTPTHKTQYYHATFEDLDDVRVGRNQYVLAGNTLAAIFTTTAAEETQTASGPLSPWERAGVRADDPEASIFNLSRSDVIPNSPHPRPLPGGEGGKLNPQSLASADRLSPALAAVIAAGQAQLPEHDPRSLATFTDDDIVITWHGQLTITPISEADLPDRFAGPDDVMVNVKGKPATIHTDQDQTISAPDLSLFKQSAGLLAEGSPDSPVTLEAKDLGQLTGTEFAVDQHNAAGYMQGPGRLTAIIKNNNNNDAASNPHPLTVDFNDRLNLTFFTKQPAQKADHDQPIHLDDTRIKGVQTADFLGPVHVDDDKLDMTTDRLTLALVENPPKDDDKMAVQSITALGNVKANVKEQDVKLFADRLVADPAHDQLDLFGSTGTPARVVRPDATLAGEHMVMDDDADTVTVPGPGGFDYIPHLDHPDNTVHVTWADRMHYDDIAGTARFLGDIKTLAIDGTDTNELMGDDLLLTFVKSDTAQDAEHAEPAAQGRQLAEAVMDGNVRFRARSYETAQRKNLQTELYLVGSKMQFNDQLAGGEDQSQKVQIPGKGRMLITDSRSDASSDPDRESSGGINFAGHGKTAFEWSDSLNLDLTRGDMLMKGAVAMVHQPPPGSAPESSDKRVQLDCHDLAAEMTKPAPGSQKQGDGWLSDNAPAPQLDRVWADGGVRILTGDLEVNSDHMLYEEAKREIILWSDEPNVVTYQAKDQPTPATSSAFKWHRDTGRVEAFKLRTGSIPLRRSEREKDE